MTDERREADSNPGLARATPIGLNRGMKLAWRTLGVGGILLFLVACGQPLPADRVTYAGDWRSPEMRLVITSGGRVDYRRASGSGGSTSVKAPIQKFDGNDFIAGIAFFNTRFVVSKPPALQNGVWKMTVDGVELTRMP